MKSACYLNGQAHISTYQGPDYVLVCDQLDFEAQAAKLLALKKD